MFFSFIIIVLIGIVAFFHYIQGFFTATVSAILAVISAVFAVGMYEYFASMLAGKMDEQIGAMAIVLSFAAMYAVTRILFEKLIPGNVSFPLMVDKVGAGIAGVVAGIASVGILMIATQMLPFRGSILGWSRYEIQPERTITIVPKSTEREVEAVLTEMNGEKFIADDSSGPLVPADKWVLGIVKLVSAKVGSLSNNKPFASVHPNLLQELYGQRVTMPPGMGKTALSGSATIKAVFVGNGFEVRDQERLMKDPINFGVRSTKATPGISGLEPKRNPAEGYTFVILRANLTAETANADQVVFFGPAAVRLCAYLPEESRFANFFPIGTMDGTGKLYVNQPDDVLIAENGKNVDFVFEVPKSVILMKTGETPTPDRLTEGSFFEFKRFARVMELDKMKLATYAPASSGVVRKTGQEQRLNGPDQGGGMPGGGMPGGGQGGRFGGGRGPGGGGPGGPGGPGGGGVDANNVPDPSVAPL